MKVGQRPEHAMETPASKPPYLLTLPPEIRCRILKYVLISPSPIQIDYQYHKLNARYSLAWTCRHLYHEAIPIFLTRNTFAFATDSWTQVSQGWLQKIGPQKRSLIRSIYLNMWSGSPWPKIPKSSLPGLERILTRDYDTFDVRTYNLFRWRGKSICRDSEDFPGRLAPAYFYKGREVIPTSYPAWPGGPDTYPRELRGRGQPERLDSVPRL